MMTSMAEINQIMSDHNLFAEDVHDVFGAVMEILSNEANHLYEVGDTGTINRLENLMWELHSVSNEIEEMEA